eukprot:CAMPEP_0119372012 /NCGR_PEP_ID=MMETSP1334-20130426/18069_1 /TAXON_ID=127549 /ORGANISM="Calcidiscus leptoporus, Strain RCC1130" /LENGTH=102 /DNA_ID=CAMNT_0007389395 /DNA_START=437 /DNA_END=746 /DNA_ORIENTATION=-
MAVGHELICVGMHTPMAASPLPAERSARRCRVPTYGHHNELRGDDDHKKAPQRRELSCLTERLPAHDHAQPLANGSLQQVLLCNDGFPREQRMSRLRKIDWA